MRREDRLCEVLLFALTPPRLATAAGRVQEIADATIARLRTLDLDGLILYDIDDEAERNPARRPFPFTRTLDPADFADYLLRPEEVGSRPTGAAGWSNCWIC